MSSDAYDEQGRSLVKDIALGSLDYDYAYYYDYYCVTQVSGSHKR